MQVVGHSCPTFRDESGLIAARLEASLQPISWEPETLCDRHDARHMLDANLTPSTDTGTFHKDQVEIEMESYRYLPPWAGGFGFVGACFEVLTTFLHQATPMFLCTEGSAPEAHIAVLQSFDDPRFNLGALQLEQGKTTDSLPEDKRQSAAKGSAVAPPAWLSEAQVPTGTNATPANASGGSSIPPELPVSWPIAADAFVQPYRVALPPGAALPSSWAQHKVMERTAYQVAANPALEVLLLVRQAQNAKLAFLQPSNELQAYYAAIKHRATAGLPAHGEERPSFPCDVHADMAVTPAAQSADLDGRARGRDTGAAPVQPAGGGLVDYDSDASSNDSNDSDDNTLEVVSSEKSCALCDAVAPPDPLATAFGGLPTDIFPENSTPVGALHSLMQRWQAYISTKPPVQVKEACVSITKRMAHAAAQHWARQLWSQRLRDNTQASYAPCAWMVRQQQVPSPAHRLLALKAALVSAVRLGVAAALEEEAAATAAAPAGTVMQLHSSGNEHGSAFASLRAAVLLSAAALSTRVCGSASSGCHVTPLHMDSAGLDGGDEAAKRLGVLHGCRVQDGVVSIQLHVSHVQGGCLDSPLHLVVSAPSSTRVQAIATTLQRADSSQADLHASLMEHVIVHTSVDASSQALQQPGRLGGAKRRRRFGGDASAAGEEGGVAHAEGDDAREAQSSCSTNDKLERARLLRGRFRDLTSTALGGSAAASE